MTDDLLGLVDGDEAEALDFLPEEKPATPASPASTTRKNPPTPIRLTPPEPNVASRRIVRPGCRSQRTP